MAGRRFSASHDDAGAALVQPAAIAALGAAARLGDGLEGLDGIHFYGSARLGGAVSQSGPDDVMTGGECAPT
jgi:hypothetical protein